MVSPSQQMLRDSFRAGSLWLHFDCYKPSGKWYAGGWFLAKISVLEEARFDSLKMIEVIDKHQEELTPRSVYQYHVVLDDDHLNFIEEYHGFYKRLYLNGGVV